MYTANERRDLKDHCGFIAIYLGLFYNAPELLTKFKVNNVSDLYDLINLEIFKLDIQKIFDIIDYSSIQNNTKVKICNDEIELKNICKSGIMTYQIIHLISYYFNIHIRIKNKENINFELIDQLNKINIQNPVCEFTLLITKSKNNHPHIIYEYDFHNIESKIDVSFYKFNSINEEIDLTQNLTDDNDNIIDMDNAIEFILSK